MESKYFYTVGQLKKALGDLPDDRLISCQVVATDGKVWNMWGEFCPQVPQGTIACLTFKHDELTTLPNEKNVWSYFPEQKPNYGDEIIICPPPEQLGKKEMFIYDRNTYLIDGTKWFLIPSY